MTIEEIKEIRATVRATEQEYFNAHAVEIVDTLQAEVERLEKLRLIETQTSLILGRINGNL